MDKGFAGSLKIPAGDVLPTCWAACPVHTDTREYVQCVSRGDYEGASTFCCSIIRFRRCAVESVTIRVNPGAAGRPSMRRSACG